MIDLIFDFVLLLWYTGTILICANMWREGGAGHSLVRNPGVPILLAISRWMLGYPINDGITVFFYIPAAWAMIRMFSYGVKSPVHKFWVWIFGRGEDGNDVTVEFATRTTCAFFWTLPAALFCIASGKWTWYWPYVLLMSPTIGYVGATVKEVEISERVVGACVAMAIFL